MAKIDIETESAKREGATKEFVEKKWAVGMCSMLAVVFFLMGLCVGGFAINNIVTHDMRIAYANDVGHVTDLSSYYSDYFGEHGAWPPPGSYDRANFKYIGTYVAPNGNRNDEYYTAYDGGMRIDFELLPDGTIWAHPIPV